MMDLIIFLVFTILLALLMSSAAFAVLALKLGFESSETPDSFSGLDPYEFGKFLEEKTNNLRDAHMKKASIKLRSIPS